MYFLFELGLLLITGYLSGWLVLKAGMPRIIGYIAAGIIFSPQTFSFTDRGFIEATSGMMDVSLAFIAFEVGGELKWKKIHGHEKQISGIALSANLLPFIFISGSIISAGVLFPDIFSFSFHQTVIFSIILAALSVPSAPASVLAVAHQYRAKGNVTNTVLEVVALSDIIGIFIFSMSIAVMSLYGVTNGAGFFFKSPLLDVAYKILGAIILGGLLGLIITSVGKFFKVKGEGQWIVIIFSFLVLSTGISKILEVDNLLANLAMGMMVVNTSGHQALVFKLIKRYTEDFIFLFFFLLSGLHLDINKIPMALPFVFLFVFLRMGGKFTGTYLGGRVTGSRKNVRKYVAGGLIPQAGIVIGLVLEVFQHEGFGEISDILLATIMGSTIIHELFGPFLFKYSLQKAGETRHEEPVGEKRPISP